MATILEEGGQYHRDILQNLGADSYVGHLNLMLASFFQVYSRKHLGLDLPPVQTLTTLACCDRSEKFNIFMKTFDCTE